jgi:hypothetical protein
MTGASAPAGAPRTDEALAPGDSAAALTPVFIFSLPRSGSTLLQRILATHPAVATASEPWILLPFLYARRRQGIYAEYNHRKAIQAIEDFAAGLPGGEAAYRVAVRDLAMRLYREHAGPEALYFVDKTPRYQVISADIVRTFEAAKFIFLWRNPLAVIASLIEGWGRGRWNIYEFELDLFDGLAGLIDGQRIAGDRAISVDYRDLVAESTEPRARIFSYLGLNIDEARPDEQQGVQLTGRMGDQTGVRAYRELSQAPLSKWTRTLASPLRKLWCRRYLRWIGRERLKLMRFDLEDLLRQLDEVPTSWRTVSSDAFRMLFGFAVRVFEPWIVRDKLASLRTGARNRAHA